MNASRMTKPRPDAARRAVLAGMGASAAALALPGFPPLAQGQAGDRHMRKIPATGEAIPALGMGSWITFNVGPVPALREARVKVLQAFFDRGGAMVDSSPMYGSSEEVIGYCLGKIENDDALFSATKVWTLSQERGIEQMQQSERLWGEKRFDLMQIHNLLDWDAHLETLTGWKAKDRIRYIGVTTSHGRRHDDLEGLMKTKPFDFVQFTYNILDRDAEKRLLPLAADKGLAVICNRPFRRKQLITRFRKHPLPDWAGEIDCTGWPQFLLKYVISHPAVTCAIPATSRVDHMNENMGALKGRLPDEAMRRRMVQYVESL